MSENLEFDLSQYSKERFNIRDKKYVYRFWNDSNEYAGRVFYITLDQQNQSEFNQNISTLKNLDYVTILRVFGYSKIKEDGISYPIIITEFMKRKSAANLFFALLHKHVSKSWTDTKKYIVAIGTAYAIKFLHSKDLIHKNLRPSKILFDEHYYPHVSYLDIINDYEEEQATEPIYIAPELFDDPENFSKASDIYAYSMIVYQLLTGKPPFKNPHSIKLDIENQNYPSINDFDDSLSTFFENCWYNDSSSRPEIDDIIDMLKTDEVMDEFGQVDEDEVNSYLSNLESI